MADKPTYKKLESTINELKTELVKNKQNEKVLLKSKQKYKNITIATGRMVKAEGG